MGGKGSGRKPEPKTPIGILSGQGEEFFIPNLSGDHSAGNVQDTPVDPTDLVNKAYVDSVPHLMQSDSTTQSIANVSNAQVHRKSVEARKKGVHGALCSRNAHTRHTIWGEMDAERTLNRCSVIHDESDLDRSGTRGRKRNGNAHLLALPHGERNHHCGGPPLTHHL